MKIGLLLKRAHWLFSCNVNEEFKDDAITKSQCDVLFHVLSANEKNCLINQRMIEHVLHLTNPTVTGIINRLETKELIKRVEDLNDKRIKNLYITDKGKEILQAIKGRLDKCDQLALSNLTTEEIETLNNLLNKVINNLKGDKDD